jgi:hypothetical protein
MEVPVRGSHVMALVLVTASGCAPTAAPSGNGLARELAGYTAGPPQACVPTFANQNLRVIDNRTLAYGYGTTMYVNHLPGPCPALEPLNTLIVDAQGGQYCRGDRVRGLEPGAVIPGPTCNLGNWIPYRKP